MLNTLLNEVVSTAVGRASEPEASEQDRKPNLHRDKNFRFLLTIMGAYHLTENFGNSGWKVNGKVTFRKFRPKIEEYVLR